MKERLDCARVKTINRRFHDEVEADNYDERMGVGYDPERVAAMVAELETVLGESLPRGGTVVDLGAGTGNVALKLALDGRFDRVVAVDISAEMLRRARQRASELGIPLQTCVSDMDPLPFEDGSVDLVVGCAILHHIGDVRAFMAEVARVLVPGGACIFIGEPSVWGERCLRVAKAPALAVVAVARRLGLRPDSQWKHDEIDVHTFCVEDVQSLTQPHFDRLVVRPEGLLEPAVDQGLLVPLQLVACRVPGVSSACAAMRRLLRWLDRSCLEPLAPVDLLASMKFAARRRV